MTKRKITTKALTAFMLAFALFLTSFSMPVMADTDFTVTIDLAGGSMSGQITFSVPAGDSLNDAGFTLGTPTRQGFIFDGWSGGFDADTPVTNNMTIVAQWLDDAPQNHTVVFNLNGGMIGGSTANQERHVPHNQSINSAGLSMPQPTKQGYTFNNWQITSAGSGVFNPTTTVTSNMTVVAQWTANQPTTVTVTFNPAQGTLSGGNNRTVNVNQTITAAGVGMPTATRPGHTFVRWQMPNGAEFTATTPIAENMTVTAIWAVTITFNLNQGVIGNSPANVSRIVPSGQSIANTPGVSMPENPTRPGFTFDSWRANNADFHAGTIVTVATTVTAQWTANLNQATVTFNLNGGHINNSTHDLERTVPVGQTINNATNVAMPSNPIRAGYTFGGWRLSNNNTFNGNSVVNSNITVTAHWTSGNQAVITFDLDGGRIGTSDVNPTRTVNRGQSINNASGVSMPQNPTRSGFTFVRWELSNGDIFTGATVVDNNTTVYAQWVSGDRFIVTFDLNNGRIGNNTINPFRAVNRNQSINNTSGVSMPANPTRQGFTFAGWELQNGNEFTGTTVVNAHITVTAQWVSGNQATITFNLAGGTIGNNNTNPTRVVTIGQNINNTANVSMPANPTRQGFTFAGWQLANGNPFTATTVVNSNITVTAQWTSGNQATVTFNLNGGAIGTITANQTRDIPIGQNIANTAGVTLPPDPTKQGFIFSGWQMANGQVFNVNTIVNNSFTVTAQWTFGNAQPPAPVVNQIITLDEHGVITSGGNVVNLAADMGRFHINADGVSVLPARAVLSVLFGANPYDPNLFIWYADISTFVIDPLGHNIRIQVNNQTMFVGGMPRTIMSGEGDAAFPYAAYVDPRDSRLYAPVRAIAESVGFTVEWNAETSTVTLVPPGLS